MKKYDELQDEVMDLEKKLKIKTEEFEEFKVLLNGQDKNLDELKRGTDEKIEITEDFQRQIDDEIKVQKEENERNRRLAQENAAVKAKLEFIETKYDNTESVDRLNLEDFRNIT